MFFANRGSRKAGAQNLSAESCAVPTCTCKLSRGAAEGGMSWQDPAKVPAAFQDGIPYFSEEEWKPLQEWQKDLYRSVMNEVQQALLSLGPLIVNAVFSLRSKENENFCPENCDRKDNVNHSPIPQVGSSDSSDMMNNGKDKYSCKPLKSERITEDEEPALGCDRGISLQIQLVNDPPCTTSSGSEESEIVNHPTKECSVNTSMLSVKQETETVNEKSYKNTECGSSSSPKFDQIEEHSFILGDQVYASADNVNDCNFNQKSSPVENTFPNTRRRMAEITSENSLIESASAEKHEKMQTGFKLYICSQCGNYFSQRSNVVPQPQPNTCSVCQQGKEGKAKRKPGGKGPHKCKDCGKGFITFRSLLVHQRIHTGEKPYACTECGRCFTVMANLITHQRIHTGEKPFTCSLCEKSFRQLPHLVKHKRMHTGEKPFSCNVCDKRYTDSSALVRHHQVHARENV